MAKSLGLELKGLKEAKASLKAFGAAVRNKHVRIALNAAGGTIRDEAKKLAPRETGLLRRSLKVKVVISAKKGGVAIVGAARRIFGYVDDIPSKRGKTRLISKKIQNLLPLSANTKKRSPSRYAHLVEGGTRKHTISTKFKRVLASKARIFGSTVSVGARPKPFLETAGRSKGSVATQRAIRKLSEAATADLAKRTSGQRTT